MSSTSIGGYFQFKCCCTQYYIILNVGYFSAPKHIYTLKYRHSNSNINVVNLEHVFVGYNIAPNVNSEACISCWIYHPYIYQRKKIEIYEIF